MSGCAYTDQVFPAFSMLTVALFAFGLCLNSLLDSSPVLQLCSFGICVENSNDTCNMNTSYLVASTGMHIPLDTKQAPPWANCTQEYDEHANVHATNDDKCSNYATAQSLSRLPQSQACIIILFLALTSPMSRVRVECPGPLDPDEAGENVYLPSGAASSHATVDVPIVDVDALAVLDLSKDEALDDCACEPPRYSGNGFGWALRAPGVELMLEIFSPSRVAPVYCAYGGSGVFTDAKSVHGGGWDGSLWEDRAQLRRWQATQEPDFALGCPPCFMFSPLQHTNKRKMTPGEYEDKLAYPNQLLDLQMAVFKDQIDGCRCFLFEHPRNATS